MANQMNEAGVPAALAVWNLEDHAFTVEYSLSAMGEIRTKVIHEFRRLGRGGLETGGVLFGQRGGDTVRVLAWRPIPCSHQRGPSFLLSPEDAAELRRLLDRYSKEPALSDLTPVGWFHSHTRSEICLTAEDLALHNQFFPEPWQVALVIKPEMDGSTRAGFFFREPGGQIRTESSYKEFNLEAFSGSHRAFENALRSQSVQKDVAPAPVPVQPPVLRTEPPPVPVQPPVLRTEPPPSPKAQPARGRTVWWTLLWLVACVLAGFAGALASRFRAPAPEPPLTLQVRESGGQLQADWILHDPALAAGAQGRLVITDGGSTSEIALDRQALQRGHLTLARRSERVQVTLVVPRAGGSPLEETALFVGHRVEQKAAAETEELKSRVEELERENSRLQDARKRETTEAEQMKRQYYRLLQERLREERRRK